MKTQFSKKGFTLVEIMIVVVIIGLLAALAIPAFKKVRNNAIEKTIINDAKQIASAANQAMSENAAPRVLVADLCKYVAGARLSSGVTLISSAQSTTNPAPAAAGPNVPDFATAAIPVNTVIGTVNNTTGAVTAGAGVVGTLEQNGTFILQHLSFDKTLSSNNQVLQSLPVGTIAQIQFDVDGGTISPVVASGT